MTTVERPAHVGRIRREHVNAIKALKDKIEKAQGIERVLLESSEQYHIARLHLLWFSSSRREKQY